MPVRVFAVGGPVRARDVILVYAFLLALALLIIPQAHAATFACEIRASCLSNQTLLLRLNSSESGQAPNNSHAQLANYSGSAYPYSVCCWTDSFRTIENSCIGNSFPLLSLQATSDSHVQASTQSGYAYDACINVTPADLTCEYPNDACSSGYTGILSIASSEVGDDNLTNAHVADFNLYKRKVCCQIAGLTPPTVASVNLAPINTTKRIGLTCNNGSVADADGDSVTLHYNWYHNGTSITVLNLPMDYDDTNGITHDISGFANNASVSGATFLPTSGQVGGTFSFDGTNDYLNAGNDTELQMNTNAFTITLWLKAASQTASIIDKKNGSTLRAGYRVNMSGTTVAFTISDGSSSVSLNAGTATSGASWNHYTFTRNASGMFAFTNGVADGSTTSGGALDVRSVMPIIIGANNSFADAFLNGQVDEIMIFNHSLTPNEILTLYNTNNRNMNQSELQKSDFWNCSITPVDSAGLSGSTVYSNGSYVNASTPYAVNLSYPFHNNQSVFERLVNFSWTTADEPDGDQVNYTLSILVTPGACSVQSTLTNLQTTNRTVGELCVDQKYNWTVNACDVDGCSGNTTTHNFTIASVIGIVLRTTATQFGAMAVGQMNATDGPGGPSPLILENDGNVYVNVTLNATQSPFSSVALGDAAFQYRIADNETGSFNASGSQITYTAVPVGPTPAIKQLNYTDTNDTVRIHTNITVPINEPPGTKTANLTLRASISQTP